MVNVDDAVIARLESYGERFEILVEAELAADYKRGEDIEIEKVLAVEEIFKDGLFFDLARHANEMASYIKEMNYDEKKIVGFGFKDVSLQPYFEKNLYTNMDEAIYRWSNKNKDFYTYCNFEKYDRSDFTDVPEYIVLEWDETDVRIDMIEKCIEETNKYENIENYISNIKIFIIMLHILSVFAILILRGSI